MKDYLTFGAPGAGAAQAEIFCERLSIPTISTVISSVTLKSGTEMGSYFGEHVDGDGARCGRDGLSWERLQQEDQAKNVFYPRRSPRTIPLLRL